MSTTSFQSAENALTNEITRMQGIIDARDVLREIGTLRQAADEAGKRMEAARVAEATAQADLEKIQLRVANAQAAADVEVAKAEQAADVVLTKSKVAGAAIIEAAKSQAAKILADAETKTADARARAAALSDAIAKAQGS
jgi:hypothetical protein